MLDLSGGRLEVGVGTGGTPSSFTAFGLDSAHRSEIYDRHLAIVRDAWDGRPLEGGDTLYPAAPGLNDRVWQATFSVGGGIRAGKAGDGLMLSRTQPRPKTRRAHLCPTFSIPSSMPSRGAARRAGAADRRLAFAVRRGQQE